MYIYMYICVYNIYVLYKDIYLEGVCGVLLSVQWGMFWRNQVCVWLSVARLCQIPRQIGQNLAQSGNTGLAFIGRVCW